MKPVKTSKWANKQKYRHKQNETQTCRKRDVDMHTAMIEPINSRYTKTPTNIPAPPCPVRGPVLVDEVRPLVEVQLKLSVALWIHVQVVPSSKLHELSS